MNKKQLLATLEQASINHQKWLENARLLIDGAPLNQEQVPINARECAFGQWYFGDGQHLHNLPGFKIIEATHHDLHAAYLEIFVLLFEENQNHNFWQKLFGNPHKTSDEKHRQALSKYKHLEDLSHRMLQQIEKLSDLISAMNDTQITRFVTD